ncbi:MAG: hypothetical protein NZ990_10525 [Myxococcota bacterium]|nr:hypothetical protein [Myxococcota bacterium]
MKNDLKLFSKFNLAVALLVIGLVAPAGAGVVQFTGKLRAGFGNSWNISNPALGVGPSNNGLPVCAVTNPFVHQTWGTLYVQGYANQGTGTHPSIMFDARRPLGDTSGTNFVGQPGGNGGAFSRIRSTCQVKIPPFANPRLRSRTQYAGGGWPKAATTMATLAQGSGFQIGTAASVVIPIPFLTAAGNQYITKGARNYGGNAGVETTGEVIYSSYVSAGDKGLGNGVQLGINLATLTPGGLKKLATYGLIPYLGGYLPTGPNGLGDGGGTHRVLGTVTSMGAPLATPALTCGTLMTSACPQQGLGAMSSTNISQAIAPGHQTTYNDFFALRTAGPASPTVNTAGYLQQGNIQTVYGGNTPASGFCTPPGTTAAPCPIPGIPLNSTFHIRIAAHLGTTGMVKHTDMVGDYITSRSTTGSDLTGLTGQPDGATRRLQSVTPWSATIRGVGPFPIKTFIPALGFGGLGATELNIQPAPEPGAMVALGLGVVTLVGLRRARGRRN